MFFVTVRIHMHPMQAWNHCGLHSVLRGAPPRGRQLRTMWLDVAFWGRPDFQSRGPNMPIFIRSGPGPLANQTKGRSVHELLTGAFQNKSSMWIVLVFLRKNNRIHKNGRNSWTFRFGTFFGLVCQGDSLFSRVLGPLDWQSGTPKTRNPTATDRTAQEAVPPHRCPRTL